MIEYQWMMSKNNPVDVILTSFNRLDLLKITLDSFFIMNNYPVNNFIVYDDFGWDNMSAEQQSEYSNFIEKYPQIIWLAGAKRIGQIQAIDNLVKHVTTPYYLHLEDDWQFIDTGFIQDSISILETNRDIVQCWLRGVDDTNGHPIIKHNGIWSYMSTKYQWKGFSFNPAVRRLEDYTNYHNICPFDHKDPANSEKKIGEYYYKKGYRACILHKKYVTHIGDNRGIRE